MYKRLIYIYNIYTHTLDLKNATLVKKTKKKQNLLGRKYLEGILINNQHPIKTHQIHFFISPIFIKPRLKEYKIQTFADDVT